MLIGATGSGKSTLIDGMINYITGVSWEDDFRFSLVDLTEEEKKKTKNQVNSVLSKIISFFRSASLKNTFDNYQLLC